MTPLFIYGTLKRGFRLHSYLGDAQFLGEVKTEPHYRLYNLGNYPGLIQTEPFAGFAVRGELYEVSDSTLTVLDMIEGVSWGHYRRDVVHLNSGDLVSAYFYNGPVSEEQEIGPSHLGEERSYGINTT